MTATAGDAGADTLPEGLQLLAETFSFSQRAHPLLGFGHYATVIDTGGPQALALATDTIGTKALIAQALGKFDTAGIDCVAMNANDIVCVGAEPIAMVDCMLVEEMDEAFLAEIAVGLREGARRARISIPGGETARVPEMLRGARPGRAFDLGGTCAGLVERDRILTGAGVAAGDALVGFASSGIHSNGFTLARRTFREAGWELGRHVEEFGSTLGEELLEPTAMYVDLAMSLLRELDVRALFHITGGGFLNLRRLEAEAGFTIEALPPVPGHLPRHPAPRGSTTRPCTPSTTWAPASARSCPRRRPSAPSRLGKPAASRAGGWAQQSPRQLGRSPSTPVASTCGGRRRGSGGARASGP